MTRWLPLTLLLTLLACSSGSHGVLEPMGGPGVTLTSTHGHANDTARLLDGGVTADVIGSWGVKVESLDVTYVGGAAPTRIALASTSQWKDRGVPISIAWDASARTNDMIGHPRLHDEFVLGAHQRKTVTILYETKSEDPGPDSGDEITIAVPMPGGARPVRFRVAGE